MYPIVLLMYVHVGNSLLRRGGKFFEGWVQKSVWFCRMRLVDRACHFPAANPIVSGNKRQCFLHNPYLSAFLLSLVNLHLRPAVPLDSRNGPYLSMTTNAFAFAKHVPLHLSGHKASGIIGRMPLCWRSCHTMLGSDSIDHCSLRKVHHGQMLLILHLFVVVYFLLLQCLIPVPIQRVKNQHPVKISHVPVFGCPLV